MENKKWGLWILTTFVVGKSSIYDFRKWGESKAGGRTDDRLLWFYKKI